MEVTIEALSSRLKIYEGIMVRVCKYLGIQLYDQTLDSRIGGKAVLKSSIIHFIEENHDFFKKYHDDYYLAKTPEQIAFTINRHPEIVNEYLVQQFPKCFENGVFIPEKKDVLKYMSSYEVDFDIGNETKVNNSLLGVTTWHLGFKQQIVVERLNRNV